MTYPDALREFVAAWREVDEARGDEVLEPLAWLDLARAWGALRDAQARHVRGKA